MAEYNTQKTGAQVTSALNNGLYLGALATAETISGKSLQVLWKVAPTNSNTVYGLAIDSTNGEWLLVQSVNGVKSAKAIGKGSAAVAPNPTQVTQAATVTNHALDLSPIGIYEAVSTDD